MNVFPQTIICMAKNRMHFCGGGTAISKGKVLCIAEGEGRNSVYLASLGLDVTAWDLPAGLEKTKQLADEKVSL